MLVFFDLFKLVVFDDQMTVVHDRFHAIIFDANILILFGVNKNLLRTFFVFETKFVKTAAAFRRIRFDASISFFRPAKCKAASFADYKHSP